MNSRDFKVLFLYEWKSKHYAAFGNGSVSERTIWRWYAKFETGDESFTNEDRGRLESVVNNGVLWEIVEKNTGNTETIRDYIEEFGVSPTIISRHLKFIGKVH